MFKIIRDFFHPHDLNRIIKTAQRLGQKRFLVIWNRGLGDVALGLYAFIKRVKEDIPEAEITFITRPDLLEAFSLMDSVKAIAVPWWKRGDKLTSVDARKALDKLKLQLSYDVIIEKIDPTKRLKDQIGRIVPRLIWKSSYDTFCNRFNPYFSLTKKKVVGIHIESETQKFYGYKKDWDLDKWKNLFDKLISEGFFIVLLGLKKINLFSNGSGSVLDLRGDTTLLECLSIIKNRCDILIAPDSGILSLTYYLDTFFHILVISIWSDPNQGVLKQAVDSPNKGLKHKFLIGKHNNISNITPEEIYEAIQVGLKETNLDTRHT